MKRLLIYYNFVIVSIIVLVGFVSASTPIQLFSAILFFPLFAYFCFKILPKNKKAIHLPSTVEIQPPSFLTKDRQELTPDVVKLKKEGVDIDRRAFLKLIGAAGISVFLFSMFTKKAEAAFFGSVPGPGTVAIKDTSGTQIDPAEKQPTDGYSISEIEDSTVSYYGFTDKDGNWFIMRGDDDTGSYRYVKGSGSFSTNWDNRASLSYDLFDEVFD